MRASCCICSDIFDEVHPISATSCGHVYHTNCLMLWIGQCKTCPICRTRINPAKNLTLYFNFVTTAVANSSFLENEVSDLKARLSEKAIELGECKKQKESTRLFVKEAEKRASDLQQIVYKSESEIADLRLRVKSAARLETKVVKLEQMNSALNNDLKLLNNVQSVVSGTKKDVDTILQECGNGSDSTKQMATYCSVLKRELEKVMDSKSKLLDINSKLKVQNCRYAAKIKSCEDSKRLFDNKSEFIYGQYTKSVEKESSMDSINAEIGYASTSSSITATTSIKKVCIPEVDISPLSAPFNNLKFNMCIGASSTTSSKYEKNLEKGSYTGVSASKNRKENDDFSIIRTGYNGFGGHSNFIKSSVMRSLKRKF